MRLLVDLTSRVDTDYATDYHHKLRGRIWRALQDTDYEHEHNDGDPMGLSYSNIFPWGPLSNGDNRQLLIASPREGLLTEIARDLQINRDFHIGKMEFRVSGMTSLDVDVGEPGTRGTIESATGVFVRLYDHHREKYDIETAYATDTPTYWRPEHTVEPFRDAITDNLQQKHERFAPDYISGPLDVEEDLFEGYDLIKTYAIPVTVTKAVNIDVVVSKWRLNYRVRNDAHRKHLNLALDTGLGGRNALGFGFVNIVDRTRPRETELGGEDAFA